MSNPENKITPVGYRRPPVGSRFKRGQSGNPGGRARAISRGKLGNIILEEAYRSMLIQEGDEVLSIPAIRAIVRAQVREAVKGNAAAQRNIIEMVRVVENSEMEMAGATIVVQISPDDAKLL